MTAYDALFRNKPSIRTDVVTCQLCHHVFIIVDGDYRLCMIHMRKQHKHSIDKSIVHLWFKYIKGVYYE